MIGPIPVVAAAGVLLPESFLQSPVYAVLAAFVAINTVIYLALAVGKLLPKIHLGGLLHRREHRAETRSIHPQSRVDD